MELGFLVLLRAAWLAAILPILLASLPFAPLLPFHKTLLSFASRGKLSQSSPHKKFTVPQSFFLHFYVVSVVWTTFLVLCTWSYAYNTVIALASESLNYSTVASYLTGGSHMFSIHKARPPPMDFGYRIWRVIFLLLMMEMQVLRRLYETIYVFNYSPSARMHVLGYLTGLFFYTAAPLSLCNIFAPEVSNYTALQIANFIVNGRDRMPDIKLDWWGHLKPFMKLGWCQWIGTAIFIWGWIHQYRCHAILGSLREHAEEADTYKIPQGDWFEIVSCPHYLAEIVIYSGILVASGGTDLMIWLLFGFVVSNLVFAAAETHRCLLSWKALGRSFVMHRLTRNQDRSRRRGMVKGI